MRKEYRKKEGDPCCGTCWHFYQHYVQTGGNEYMKCSCGHCVRNITEKRLSPLQKACEAYEEKPKPIRFRLKRRAFQRTATLPKSPFLQKAARDAARKAKKAKQAGLR